MQVQRVTRIDGVRESVCVGWERPRCSAPPASAPPRWSLPPTHATHSAEGWIRYRTQPSGVPSWVRHRYLIQPESVPLRALIGP